MRALVTTTMDVVPIPEPKKTTFLRANAEQLKVLKVAFAASNVTAKHSLAALSEATGLYVCARCKCTRYDNLNPNESTHKWISSWFTRERKKNATATARRAAKVKTTTMSVEEITAFKTENHDPALPLAAHAPTNPETEQKPIISSHATKKTGRKPRMKRNSDPESRLDVSTTSNAIASPLRSPFSSALLAPRVLSLAVPSLAQVTSNSADVSASPSFISRPTVPLLHMPPCSSSNLLVPALPSTKDPASHAIPNRITTSATPTSSLRSATIGNSSVSVSEENHAPNDDDVTDESQFVPVGGPSFISPSTNRTRRITTTATHSPYRSGLRPIEPKNGAQTQNQDRDRNLPRPLRPLLPLYTASSAHPADSESLNPFQLLQTLYAPPPLHGPIQTPDGGRSKENHIPGSYPYPSTARARLKHPGRGAPALKPLFSYENLNLPNAASHQPQVPYPACAPPPEYPAHSYSQPQARPRQYPDVQPVLEDALSAAPSDASLYDSDHHLDHTRFPQDSHTTVLDPTTSPLKHLDVVPPFTSETLLADDMVLRLLDERLAQEDPFQAAMGLVLVSRLGMTWDMS